MFVVVVPRSAPLCHRAAIIRSIARREDRRTICLSLFPSFLPSFFSNARLDRARKISPHRERKTKMKHCYSHRLQSFRLLNKSYWNNLVFADKNSHLDERFSFLVIFQRIYIHDSRDSWNINIETHVTLMPLVLKLNSSPRTTSLIFSRATHLTRGQMKHSAQINLKWRPRDT